MTQSDDDARGTVNLSSGEASSIGDRLRPRAAVIYEVVRHEGKRELERPTSALFWSGLAAGLSISFSLVAEGVLHAHLPDADWRPLLVAWGYPIGFLIVVMARQQLFTENTLTAVLPVMAHPSRGNVAGMLRLWGVVLASNVIGTAAFAGLVIMTPAVPSEVSAGMLAVAREIGELSATETFWRAIIAGWLVAAMVWLLPAAEGGAVWIVVIVTYIIAISGSSHIIVGSTEAALLIFAGEFSPADALFVFFLPTLIGNIVGGSALFALLSYAQIRHELHNVDG